MNSLMKSTIVLSTNHKNGTICKPEICPHCGKGIDAKVINNFHVEKNGLLIEVVCLQCPVCGNLFFCYYPLNEFGFFYSSPAHYSELIGGGFLAESFSEEIASVSPRFVETFNQAYKAEQVNLGEIMGMGYRKAFESLIKDYACFLKPDDRDKIVSMTLFDCIQLVFSKEEREIIEKTSWIGNDETHYEKKHPAFDYKDLKAMIKICISKIETKVKEINYLKSFEKEDKGTK